MVALKVIRDTNKILKAWGAEGEGGESSRKIVERKGQQRDQEQVCNVLDKGKGPLHRREIFSRRRSSMGSHLKVTDLKGQRSDL